LTRTRNFKIQQNFFQKSLGEKLDGGFWLRFFQAKDFYLKHEYEVLGILDDCPKGHKRYYMEKVLEE
jgi:hypothetical protein